MGTLEGLITRANSFDGYMEKASNAYLDSYTANKGYNNYQRFSRDVNAAGLAGCQAQPWCGTYQFAQELYEFGKDVALKHWHMTPQTYVGYNCFSTLAAFERAGKTGKEPRLGALVIFEYSHMGRVARIFNSGGKKKFYCNEGNTSGAQDDRNGGMVKTKIRGAYDANIRAFCYIDYEDDAVVEGWRQAADGKRWWYEYSDRSWAVGWKDLNTSSGKRRFYFDEDGYMLTGWQIIDGNWYFFETTKGSEEGALYRTNDKGVQAPWRL